MNEDGCRTPMAEDVVPMSECASPPFLRSEIGSLRERQRKFAAGLWRMLLDMENTSLYASKAVTIVLLVSGVLAAIGAVLDKNVSLGWGAAIMLVIGSLSFVQRRRRFFYARSEKLTSEMRDVRDLLLRSNVPREGCDPSRSMAGIALDAVDRFEIWSAQMNIEVMSTLLWLAMAVLLLAIPMFSSSDVDGRSVVLVFIVSILIWAIAILIWAGWRFDVGRSVTERLRYEERSVFDENEGTSWTRSERRGAAHMLEHLIYAGGISTLADLKKCIDVDSGCLSMALVRSMEKGLITIERYGDDSKVILTEKGLDAFKEIIAEMESTTRGH